jgi:hypothetical protein
MSGSAKDPAAFLKMLDARTGQASPRHEAPVLEPGSGPAVADSTRAPRLTRVLPHAECVESGSGACVRVTARAPLSGTRSPEGYACPVSAFDHPAATEALALLGRDDAWRSIPRERVAYVDIETTSLQGGSGTVAFLIGVGRFEGDGFCVRQYFMEDFDQEPAMIRAVADDLARADAIVTYNGKSFDVPIMEMRWRLARMEPDFPKLHLDLLHPSRRLWSGRLPDCRLGTVERQILSILRTSDAPSAEIPQIYFDFVRGVRPARMSLVFDHHAQDIFSLAALTRALSRAVAEPNDPRFLHASEQAGLARLFQSAGRREDAVAALARAVDAAGDDDTAYRLSMLLARQLKRHRREAEAVQLWERWAGKAAIHRLDPLIELAKDAEHRLKDHAAAERWTGLALGIVQGNQELADWLGSAGPASPAALNAAELQHRLRRIQAKSLRLPKNPLP